MKKLLIATTALLLAILGRRPCSARRTRARTCVTVPIFVIT